MYPHFTVTAMHAVSKNLYQILRQLQDIPALTKSSLVGGTNLAIRYGHRVSHDIDIFFPGIIGKPGFAEIDRQVKSLQDLKIIASEYPLNLDDLRVWFRCFILSKGETIKVDFIQNMNLLDPPETINGIRLATERDIALMKLMASSNRATRKDVYDLDYLTDKLRLSSLMTTLQEKIASTSLLQQSVFELDSRFNPVDNPELLLRFELPQDSSGHLWHGNQILLPLDGHKNWNAARASWRGKVRAYFRELGRPFPTLEEVAVACEPRRPDEPDMSMGYSW